jgi:hypothetical protein
VATPEALSEESGVSTVPPVEQLPLVKKVKVTDPVGVPADPVTVPADPVTVATSVTDVPAATDVTTEVTVVPFCVMAVDVLLVPSVMVTPAEAVVSSWAELHPFVVTLHMSLHDRSAVSDSPCDVEL